MKIKIVKFTDDNNESFYQLEKRIFGIFCGYLYKDGETGNGSQFKTLEEAERIKNSFYLKKEKINQ